MPIQLSIKQPTGVDATYHVVQSIPNDFLAGSAQVVVFSYLDQPNFAAGSVRLNSQQIDVTPMLSITSAVPSGSFQQVVQNMVEQYLLTLPQFQGGTQVS